jgi:hypothetical protein
MSARVNNPLTIIAAFAGLAEVFATVALINTPEEIQRTFVYFVMGFPTLLVILFFLVLAFNNKALYAPSDFSNQEHYLEANRIRQSVSLEVEEGLRDSESSGVAFTEEQIDYIKKITETPVVYPEQMLRKTQIENLIERQPSTAKEIVRKLNLNRSYTYRLLSELESENRVVGIRNEKSGERLWQIAKNT